MDKGQWSAGDKPPWGLCSQQPLRFSFWTRKEKKTIQPFRKGEKMSILIWIITGIIAGWIAGLIVRGAGFGLLGDLVIGLIGGLIGGFIAGLVGLSPTNWLGQVAVAAVGGVILVWILHLIHPGVVRG
jgi:uncharacterized membrane protein YeaQ/YmgE (transglycosylase-associated protein family)